MNMHPNDREYTDADYDLERESNNDYWNARDEQDGIEHHIWE